MLIDANQSCLLVIDVQDKVLPAVQHHQQLVDSCSWIIKVAQLLKVPVLASEQYPRGLGHTTESLQTLINDSQIKDKVHFSCADSSECMALIEQQQREQVIIVGMEAHVCVLQTAIGLKESGKQVFVVADAISSRSQRDNDLAIARMRDLGIQIVTREMVGFEWLRRSDAEQFKTYSKDFLQ